MYGMTYQLVNALVFGCGNGNYRHTEHCLHSIHVDCALISDDLVHHIKRNDHRHIHFEKLHRKIQISFDIGSVNYIYYSFRLFIEHKIS